MLVAADVVVISAAKKTGFPTIASIESFVPSAKGSGGDYVSLGELLPKRALKGIL